MIEFKNMEKSLESMLNTGAFLTSDENPMTISWGMVGVMWGKKIVVAVVRDSRFTKTLIDQNGEFTLSIPKQGEMKEQLAFCGSKSGRDCDKWTECGMKQQDSQKLKSKVVAGCEKYFECKVLTMTTMNGANLENIEKWYATNDMHNFYFAEIVAEY